VAGTSIERTSEHAGHGEIVQAGHGVVEHHPHPVYNPDCPSEAWGWSGEWRDFAPRGRSILLGIAAMFMFAMVIGNHVSHVEDYWLVAIGLAIIVYIVVSQRSANRARRRR